MQRKPREPCSSLVNSEEEKKAHVRGEGLGLEGFGKNKTEQEEETIGD